MTRRPPKRHPGSLLGVRSLAGQVFVLQAVLVLLLVVAAVAALVVQARNDSTREARNRSVAVAEGFAGAPGLPAALRSEDPTERLQPLAEGVRERSGVDFLVVTDTDGIRYTHPKPDRIGRKFVGTIEPALRGEVVTEEIVGTIGPLVQAVVPVRDADGDIVGLVSSGITVENVEGTAGGQFPLLFGASAGALLLSMAGTAVVSRRLLRQTRGLAPGEMTRMYEHHDAVLHAVREGVLIAGADGRLVLANDEARRLLDLPPDAEGRPVAALGLPPPLDGLLASGRVAVDEVHMAGERMLAVNQQPVDRYGAPSGSVATFRDTTEMRVLSERAEVAGRRLRLLYDAGTGIGTTLDMMRTAEALARAAVPRLADFVTVDLAEPVLRGEEPAGEAVDMRRVAADGIREVPSFYARGDLIRFAPSTPQAQGYGTGRAVLEADLTDATGWRAQDPERSRGIMEEGVHSLITAPLRARGIVLGLVTFWRSEKPEPFDGDDLSLAEELVARAAVAVDNARRYTREHTMAAALQRSLLPRALPEQDALDVAYRYLPAHSGVGGDWFDVIPLSGARAALVVGDVVGHGLHAAATMGRLRTAVHNFSALDLPPDEIIGHLDELVSRNDQEGDDGDGTPDDTHGMMGATCLYAIYDPASRRCVMARAGHPPPAVVRPDGTVEFPDTPVSAPLGLGAPPYESAEIELAEGSRLVLYTDGLVEDRARDIDAGLDLLARALAGADRSPEETCDAVTGAMLAEHPRDDIALLVARTRALAADRTASWGVPSDPAAVSAVREEVARRLADWGLEEAAFTTELILSELVTNAIRHATGPVRVRLLRAERGLICEVSDTSSTSPHLRRAATTDEGGRGLFLVAQLSERWGTRYTGTGKVIWAEQHLPPA
ncbi:SpoIIE family protein phosphatase/ATP-binding protein [Streptomyces verrucosisporus]|uniref:SpoIIE family protein phosphatase/ATP-binding protein n=1 Tax=Streptomyces verrucosisporus TaxID=1695161 RepID=UPI001F128409|nr:SpoIIE family protein phosphatase/ATP-binding protein [Streptomyces verrucosisporus]